MICRKASFTLPDATYPSARAQKPRFCARNAQKRGFQTPKKHKNLDFVLEMLENKGSEGQKSTKTSILCSGRGEFALGSVRVNLRQITAHANVSQRCLELEFVCAVNCRNCDTDNQQYHLPPNTFTPARRQPHPPSDT